MYQEIESFKQISVDFGLGKVYVFLFPFSLKPISSLGRHFIRLFKESFYFLNDNYILVFILLAENPLDLRLEYLV